MPLAHLSLASRDVAGTAWSEQQQCFIVTNGQGQVVALEPQRGQLRVRERLAQAGLQWDNHLSVSA